MKDKQVTVTFELHGVSVENFMRNLREYIDDIEVASIIKEEHDND
jgi:hypothetical protein